MDQRTATGRRRLVFGSGIAGVLLVAAGTSAIFAGYPFVGIAVVAASVIGFAVAMAILLRGGRDPNAD
jgi:hypothetical protein